jgi:signal transduction histidine kinase
VGRAFNDMTARVQRMVDAQRDFVADASHQLRTPLTGLRLRLESAGLKTDDPALRRDLEAGEREADRLARTVTDLLTLAREGQPPAPARPLPLARAARAALERWESVAAERDRDLALRDDSGGAAVVASDEDVGVVLDNLVENALDHSPEGGRVIIALSADRAWGRIAVLDSGRGLAPGEEERVFERFFRGHSKAERPRGSGLGLTIVRALARRWGGEATMANRPEGGARAEVRLPRAARTAAEDAGDTAPTRTLATGA